MSIAIGGGYRVPEFDLTDRLVKARTSAGISQERMGELLGCSRRTIVRYETHGATVPRSVVLSYHAATATDLRWIETGEVAVGGSDPSGGVPSEVAGKITNRSLASLDDRRRRAA